MNFRQIDSQGSPLFGGVGGGSTKKSEPHVEFALFIIVSCYDYFTTIFLPLTI